MVTELNPVDIVKDELFTELLHAYSALEYLSDHDEGITPDYFERLGNLIKDIVPKERDYIHYFVCANGELIEK